MKNKKVIYLVMSFLVPFSLFIVYFFSLNKSFSSILIGDANEQYIIFFKYLKRALDGDVSLLYSFSSGLGGNFLSTYYYYLSSPINFLIKFVPYDSIGTFFGFLSFFKIGLSGLTMYIYLSKTKKNDEFINLLLSLCYSLMSYNIIYYFCIMWLDAVFLTPLILIGIDRIIQKKGKLFYVLMLTLCIISNFYIAYMVCIFSVIYFIYKFVESYGLNIKKNKKVIFDFLYASITSGLLSAFVIIPLIYCTTIFYRGGITENLDFGFVLSNFILSFGFNPPGKSMNYYLPYFRTNYLMFVIILNYLLYSKNGTTKKVVLIIFSFFIASILFDTLNLFWHGFSHPVGLWYRFAFLINLFIIIIANDWIRSYKKMSNKNIVLTVYIYAIVYFISFLISHIKINAIVFMINLVILISCFILLNIKANKKLKNISFLTIILCESLISLKLYLLTDYNLKKIEEKMDSVNLCYNLPDSFYRIGGTIFTENETLECNVGRTGLFLTTNNKNISLFLKHSGYYSLSAYLKENSNTDFLNSTLGIKYWYTNKELNSDYYNQIKQVKIKNKNVKIYENDKALSLAYIIDGDNLNIKYNGNPFEFQNGFSSSITRYKIYNKSNFKKIDAYNYEIDFSDKKDKYIYILSDKFSANINRVKEKNSGLTIDEKDVCIGCDSGGGYNKILKIKNEYDGVKKLKISKKYSIDKIFIYEKNDNDKKAILKLKKSQSYNVKLKKNKVSFNIDVKDNNQLLMITIPYELGWNLKIDGKVKKADKLYGAFLGTYLDKGTHKLELSYFPPGLKIGIVISASTFVFNILKKMLKK